jgi:16S rRNA (guanine966-N2)-methyltransferase
MRITGGQAGGVTLKSPRGLQTRPAADALRESLFSSLATRVEGCRFADLFAGTGSYGLEAFSRGGISGDFLERNPNSIRYLRENLARVAKSTGLEPDAFSVVKADVFKWRGWNPGGYDIIFADPPYSDIIRIESKLFELAEEILVDGGLLVTEKPAGMELSPNGWVRIKQLGKKRGQGPSLDLWEKDRSII